MLGRPSRLGHPSQAIWPLEFFLHPWHLQLHLHNHPSHGSGHIRWIFASKGGWTTHGASSEPRRSVHEESTGLCVGWKHRWCEECVADTAAESRHGHRCLLTAWLHGFEEQHGLSEDLSVRGMSHFKFGLIQRHVLHERENSRLFSFSELSDRRHVLHERENSRLFSFSELSDRLEVHSSLGTAWRTFCT